LSGVGDIQIPRVDDDGVTGIKSVAIRVDGEQVAAIPGGHFELDEPLTRSDW